MVFKRMLFFFIEEEDSPFALLYFAGSLFRKSRDILREKGVISESKFQYQKTQCYPHILETGHRQVSSEPGLL